MLQAMFSGVSGMRAHQTQMSVLGNNISNVNTVGFKSGRVSFQDQLSQTIRSGGSPTPNGIGGLNPAQVGLGVALGSIDTIQAQGNLQTTGKSSDLAIQGNGMFLVSDGSQVVYTRNGAFDLDGAGALVNQATGMKLVGYVANSKGLIDTSQPVTESAVISIPIGALSEAKPTSLVNFGGNFDASAALYSTRVDLFGNLSSADPATTTIRSAATVFDKLGNAHMIETVLTSPVDNPTGPEVPAGSTRAWSVEVRVDGATAYDSDTGKSRLYRVGGAWQFADASGAALGSAIVFDDGAGENHAAQIPGRLGAPDFDVDLEFSAITELASESSIGGSTDGQTGETPFWGATVRVYDTLGVDHLLQIRFERERIGAGAPAGATSRWKWTATEKGQSIGSSESLGNSSLYFDPLGGLVGGGSQTVTVSPTNGSSSPFTMQLDYTKATQLAADSSFTASNQDGYAAAPLQSFSVSQEGVVTGIYSNGLTRALGQVALASFANASGLEKLGNNLYRESSNSGIAQIGAPNVNGRGRIATSFLEMSNVDLSNEFTTLIVSERGFQANTRIISVIDSLLQEVINLKR